MSKNSLPTPDPTEAAALARARALAKLLDNAFKVPGTDFRIGLDALIGLIPGIGDLVGSLLSSYIITQALNHGVPKTTILRMTLNILIETIVGAVPFLGDIFDAAWKANVKNAKLLEQSLTARRPRSRADAWFIVVVIGSLIAVSFAMMTLGLWLFSLLREALS